MTLIEKWFGPPKSQKPAPKSAAPAPKAPAPTVVPPRRPGDKVFQPNVVMVPPAPGSVQAPVPAPTATAKKAKPKIVPNFVFEGHDALQVILATVALPVLALTILTKVEAVYFWLTFAIVVAVCRFLFTREKVSTVIESHVYDLCMIPIVMYFLSVTFVPAMATYSLYAAGGALMAIILYQYPIAKWIE